MGAEMGFDDGEVCAARNQALFRNVNERVEGLSRSFTLPTERVEFVCECVDMRCREQISMTRGEYEAVRRMPRRFAVKPDARHVVLEVERVVEAKDDYWVVEKVGASGREAARPTPARRS